MGINKKNVLMIVYHFPPIVSGGIKRTMEFLKYLPDHEWKPTILTIDPKTSYYPSDPSTIKNIPEKVNVIRTSTYEPLWLYRILPKLHLGRLLDFIILIDFSIFWVIPAIRAGIKIMKQNNIDIIYTSSSPYSVHLIGWWLKWRTSKPWVADWRDLWTQSVTWSGPTSIHRKFHKWVEKKLYLNASVTITHSKGHRQLIQRDFPEIPLKHIKTILMGYSPKDFFNIEEHKYDKFTILYAGSLYGYPVSLFKNKDLKSRFKSWVVDNIFDRKGYRYLLEQTSAYFFLKALREAINIKKELSTKLQVQFLGFPSNGTLRLIKELDLQDNVSHVGQLPFKDCISRMKGSSVLLLLMLPSEVGRSDFFPSKFPEYMAARRPILAMIPDSEVKEIIMREGYGVVVEPKNIDGAKKTILDYFEKYECGKMDFDPHEVLIKEITWNKLSKQLVEIFDEIKITK